MAKKTFYIIISLIIAGIFVTFGIFLVQKNATNRVLDATLIVKSRQPGFEFWELLEKGGGRLETLLQQPRAVTDLKRRSGPVCLFQGPWKQRRM